MEDVLLQFIRDHHVWTYPIILAWTFVEGETIVILCAAAAVDFDIPVELLALCAFLGSFLGDQTYYFVGRRYGAPLLKRWPGIEHRVESAFRLVKDHPVVFILTFRFIYGVRNFAPFVVGIAGVPRLQYLALNLVAAQVWAHSFAWGGYYLGKSLESWLGLSKWVVLGGFLVIAFSVAGFSYLRQRADQRRRAVIASAADAESIVQATTRPDAAA